MNKLMFAGLFVFAAFAISEISAICCHRLNGGFCRDCAVVSVSAKRACCGIGSGEPNKAGCNVFCCNCGFKKCRSGRPNIKKQSGWWLGAHYTCKLGDAESVSIDHLKDTWDTFSGMDLDKDTVISPDEFLEAVKSRLMDSQGAHLLASNLIKSDNEEDVQEFLDIVAQKETADEALVDLLAHEFRMMDANEDGAIQAREFDSDLK